MKMMMKTKNPELRVASLLAAALVVAEASALGDISLDGVWSVKGNGFSVVRSRWGLQGTRGASAPFTHRHAESLAEEVCERIGISVAAFRGD